MERLLGLEGDTGRICRFFGRVTRMKNTDMERKIKKHCVGTALTEACCFHRLCNSYINLSKERIIIMSMVCNLSTHHRVSAG